MPPALLGLLLLSFFAPAALALQEGERWPKPALELRLGPLTLDVYVSPTAHRFHLVDQLSAWDNACHGQYRAHMQLSAADEEVLKRYAAMRSQRRWGQGLEQTFYTPLELADALRAGLKAERLRPEEAEIVEEALLCFAERADALLAEKEPLLREAFVRLDRERFTAAAHELAAFTGQKALRVPVFPLASPAPGGGGMDGGRLRWEIHGTEDLSFSVLLHEVTHGFLQRRDADLQALVEGTPGLDMTLLGEGLAYAMAPGLYPNGERDELALNVTNDLAAGRGWGGTTYEHQRMFGLALRPLLREALRAGATLEAFLPRARDAFLALEEALTPRGPPTLFTAGPAYQGVKERLRASRYELSMLSFQHLEEHYREHLARAGVGDLFVLLVAGDHPERIPPAYAALSPLDPRAIERELARGRTLTEERTTEDGLRVLLLAAPTVRELEELVATTQALSL
jgi:hypothetical protein